MDYLLPFRAKITCEHVTVFRVYLDLDDLAVFNISATIGWFWGTMLHSALSAHGSSLNTWSLFF